MDQIEARADAGCTRYELFTGAKSERNISLYERRGYVRMPQTRPGLVYLEKPITALKILIVVPQVSDGHV
jgi:hypothetical protein